MNRKCCLPYLTAKRLEAGCPTSSTLAPSEIIHCRFFIPSRASFYDRLPSVVVAYLMKHKRFSLAEAMELTRAAQPTVSINPGFQAQLTLYQDMNCRLTAGDGPPTVVTADATYRWFLFADALRKFGGQISSGVAPAWSKSGENDPGPAQESPTAVPGLRSRIRTYRCKTCRATLFTCRNVIDHVHPVVLVASSTTYEAIARHGDGSSWLAARDAASAVPTTNVLAKSREHEAKSRSSRNDRGRPGTTGGTCTSIFTESLPWIGMTGAGGGLSRGERSGKIICPGRKGSSCLSKLGAWSLQGTACSCGQTVKPAIQFTLGRIEAV